MRFKSFRMLALLAASLCPSLAHAGEEETQVFIVNGELNYVGKLSAEANARLFALFQAQETKPSMLSIRSPGGNTELGMELGKWVFKNKLDVKVVEVCFSSCANYVFPAARNKIVSNFAVVGYHGGMSSARFTLDEEMEASLASLPSEAREKARAELVESFRKAMAPVMERETDYFQAIGVQQRITTLGQAEKYRGNAPEGTIGWYYSVEDFAKLGVSSITVINPPWQPRFITSQAKVFKVTVE